MKKAEGIDLLGGVAKAAADIGISESAVRLWPDPLTPAIRDRVQAALYRRQIGACDGKAVAAAGIEERRAA